MTERGTPTRKREPKEDYQLGALVFILIVLGLGMVIGVLGLFIAVTFLQEMGKLG